MNEPTAYVKEMAHAYLLLEPDEFERLCALLQMMYPANPDVWRPVFRTRR